MTAPYDSDALSLSSSPSIVTTVSDSDAATFAERTTALNTGTTVALTDTDKATLDDSVFGNGSGGVGFTVIGVVIGFADETLAAHPHWTKIG